MKPHGYLSLAAACRVAQTGIDVATGRTRPLATLSASTSLVCFDVGRLNHLAPLPNFVGDELAVIGGCHRHCVGAQIGKPCLYVGLVSSFNRPGGNVTGISSMNSELGSKRLGLLHELLPTARRFALLASVSPFTNPLVRDVQAGASTLGGEVEIIYATTNGDIDTAFAVIRRKQTDALVIAPGPLFNNNRVQLAILAARYAMPTIYSSREFTEAGGLMSYGPSITEEFRQAGVYAGRVLKGEKPADMPVMRSTKFEFVINLKTAKALGLDVPPSLLARADEVIE